MSSTDYEQIKSNWEMYEKLCSRLSDHNMTEMLDTLGNRIAMCPASSKEDQYEARPGGLVSHSLKVTSNMRSLNDAMSLGVPIASILKVGLLHDLGKVGDLDQDLFVDQDSDWHREKLGQVYKFNEDLNKMSTSHRTLYLLQHFGVQLTKEEWLAVQTAQGSHFEENRFYVGHEPSLAILLQHAKSLTVHLSRNE
jgi:hypothetical protein